jgi:hypothetical protein
MTRALNELGAFFLLKMDSGDIRNDAGLYLNLDIKVLAITTKKYLLIWLSFCIFFPKISALPFARQLLFWHAAVKEN